MATHSSILAWKFPWTVEPGRQQSMGSQREGHDWATEQAHNLFYNFYARRLVKPVFTAWSKGQAQQTWNLDWDKPEYKVWLYSQWSIINVYGPHILIVKLKINIMLVKTGSSGVIQFKFISAQSLGHVQLFPTPSTAESQASLSITNSWSLLRLMSIKSMMPPNHLILCHPLLLLPSIFPSIKVFFNESVLHIRCPKYWTFNISPFKEYSGLIFFRIAWFDLLAMQGTLKSLLQHHSSKASILWCSAFFMVSIHMETIHMVSYPHMWELDHKETIALTTWTFVDKVMSLLFNKLSRFAIAFLPRSKFLSTLHNIQHMINLNLLKLVFITLFTKHSLRQIYTPTNLSPLLILEWEIKSMIIYHASSMHITLHGAKWTSGEREEKNTLSI